jgi:hypothetical protein
VGGFLIIGNCFAVFRHPELTLIFSSWWVLHSIAYKGWCRWQWRSTPELCCFTHDIIRVMNGYSRPCHLIFCHILYHLRKPGTITDQVLNLGALQF